MFIGSERPKRADEGNTLSQVAGDESLQPVFK